MTTKFRYKTPKKLLEKKVTSSRLTAVSTIGYLLSDRARVGLLNGYRVLDVFVKSF